MYELIYTLVRLWYTKITFKGKGFKIKKRRRTRTIKFFFYHSHLNAIIFKKSKLRQKKKNKIIIKFWNYVNYKRTAALVTSVRGLNIFTKRGLRTSKQIVYKKTGKKSNY
jgi:ribosomal protein L6P/L9E